MDLTISITDPKHVLALQRALDAQNAAQGTAISAAQLAEQLVVNQCAGFAERYLVTRLDPLDFQMRFTADERVAIRAASQSSAQIADYLGLLASAKTVNLVDALVVGGVQHLEVAGLIAQGRAAEILAI